MNPTLVARKVAEVGWSLYASAAYVERAGIVSGPNVAVDDLAIDDLAVIGYREPVNHSPGAVWLSANTRPQQIVLAGDSVASVVNAVRAGMGVSALPCFVAIDQPDLVRVTSAVVAKGDLYVVIPPNHRETRRVATQRSFVTACSRKASARRKG
jgi:DNA-binding transcriptional LysR family regulator